MNTPTLTGAHYDLRRVVIYSDPDEGAELIAESEARAVAAAVTALTCTHHNDKQRTECPVCLVTALTAERGQLRAENATLRAAQKACEACDEPTAFEVRQLRARAERAESEVNRLRAGIAECLNTNGHLADGENCTLISLKRCLHDPTATSESKGGAA